MNLQEKMSASTAQDFAIAINKHNPSTQELRLSTDNDNVPIAEEMVAKLIDNVANEVNSSWVNALSEFTDERFETPNEARILLKSLIETKTKKNTKKLREG